jgi:predicted negative regulator of RcsB-dependent stress response
MTTPAAPSDPNSAEIPLSFEDRVKLTWEQNGGFIYLILGIIALGVLGKGGYEYFSAQKELRVEQDYAACTAADMLKAFADSHRGHPLAGLAELRAADMAYGSGSFGEAAAEYGQALPDLTVAPLIARAKLGLAVSQAQSGKVSDGEAALRQILGDDSQLKPIRCEAAYQLAVLEVAQGRPGEVQALMDRLMQIDPSSPFSERIVSLRTSLPDAAAPLGLPGISNSAR